MSVRYGIIGAFTIDNVVNAKGDVGVHQCGGNAFYAAVGARLWTDSIGVVARIGEDYPRQWVQQLADSGVDLSGVREIPGPHFMQGGMLYDARGDRTGFSPNIYFNTQGREKPEGMLSDFPTSDPETAHQAQMRFAPDPNDIPETFLSAQTFHLAPRYYVKHKANLALVKNHGIAAVLDPGIWYMKERDEQKVAALFADVDVLLPSEVEVRAFFGNECDLLDCARKLAEYGPKVVAIKVGPEGSLVYDRQHGRLHQVPAYATNVVDTTGAGDSYCGGFMVGYTETQDPLIAAMFGTVSSSFIVEGFGATFALQFSTTQARARLEKIMKSFQILNQ